MDYQNVHLTGHGLFQVSRYSPKHEVLIDPLHFANQLIQTRNRMQKPGMDHASLSRVLVYRGLPSPEHDPKGYARNQAQKAQWERDQRVTVQLRPLKYRYRYDDSGEVVRDVYGNKIVAEWRERGLTCCARSPWFVRHASQM
jgi:hypothetical protein